jgi:hypothetical protein
MRSQVLKRLTVLACITAFGLMLGGCSKCGFWWDEWGNNHPKSCKGDWPNN